jgi:membrane associated rhomboid family serine protease
VIQRYNPNHKPTATIALAGINVAIAIADALSGGVIERMGWARGIDVQYGEYWRLFTSGWVHADIMHILFNAYGIYVLGTIVERLHGWRPLVIIYTASLFACSALGLVFYDAEAYMRGASGAAYGLFGAVLGVFYVRTGSIRGIMQVPMGKMLLIWLAFGVFISLTPGISLLGHVGGFVPGVILGMIFEHRYMRTIDLYHKLGAGMLVVAIVALSAFACVPFTRASWYSAQALRAYESGDFERGDELLHAATDRPARDDGTRHMVTHLELWREDHSGLRTEQDLQHLRLPLTHPHGITFKGEQLPKVPFSYLVDRRDTQEPEPLETAPQQP